MSVNHDIIVSSQRKYKYGITTCHNGTVFKYTITGEVNYVNVDICFEKFMPHFIMEIQLI